MVKFHHGLKGKGTRCCDFDKNACLHLLCHLGLPIVSKVLVVEYNWVEILFKKEMFKVIYWSSFFEVKFSC